jgi:hypothetical protein
MNETLLSEWEKRPTAKWGGNKIERFNEEIAILEAIQKSGCAKTRDELSIKMQLDERRVLLRQITTPH